MNFPIITHIDQMRRNLGNHQQIRERDEGRGFISFCYMIQDGTLFVGQDADWQLECRGILFGPDGTIASRPMQKFFNVGERESTRIENLRDKKIVRVMDKRDGSMVTPVLVNSQIEFRTKKTFDNDEARNANAILKRLGGEYENWVMCCLETGFTPIFEMTSPSFPIVIQYQEDMLHLLHLRNNITGEYIIPGVTGKRPDDVVIENAISIYNPFPMAQDVSDQFRDANGDISWAMIEAFQATAKGVEGVVVQFDDGNMVKAKCQWYLQLHRSIVFVRWRDIASAVLNDTADDLKSAFYAGGKDIAPIVEVETKINSAIFAAEEEVNAIVADIFHRGMVAKDIALSMRQHPLFSLIMRKFRGAEPNYIEWFETTHLKSMFGLDVVPSTVAADGD